MNQNRRFDNRFALFAAAAVLLAMWFWPILFLGRQPLGDEITSVHLPRMAFYSDALSEGRIPLWNERDGFGTPALADGQIGVAYPPHWLLYRLLSPSRAYSASMILHFLCAAGFAFLCGRGFGLSREASMLVALMFAGQGFFIVQLTRQWSYTTGCWLPLAVTAAWRWLENSDWRWFFGLTAALAVQMLAGYLQIAFFTQCTLLLMGVACIAFCQGRRPQVLLRSLLLPVALVGAYALAAIQLVPTAELLIHGDMRGRGLEYLESFAAHPVQLVNYVAPTLFQLQSQWKPMIWMEWHTSSVECLTYVGLVPFCLSIRAAWRCRNDQPVRVSMFVAVFSVILCLGPALPGFGWLAKLPGFGWFPASARWSIVSGLFLALLAGRGLDTLDPDEVCRWARRSAAGVALALVGVAAYFWWKAGELPSGSTGTNAMGREVMLGMLVNELAFPAINIGLFVIASRIPRLIADWRVFAAFVLLWTSFDLGISATLLRRARFEPSRPLTEQSPVLHALAERTSARVGGTAGQLPMSVGAQPLANASIPDMQKFWKPEFSRAADWWAGAFAQLPGTGRWGDWGLVLGRTVGMLDRDDIVFLRLSNIRTLAIGPGQARPRQTESLRRSTTISDPWLTEQMLGSSDLPERRDASAWSIWELDPRIESSRAWLFPLSDPAQPGTDPRLQVRPPPARRQMLDAAYPARMEVDQGELLRISGRTKSPCVLVVSDQYYPGWEAVVTQQGRSQPIPIERAFGDWRALEISQPGEFEVTMSYRPETFQAGWKISLGAWILWSLGLVMAVTIGRTVAPRMPAEHAD